MDRARVCRVCGATKAEAEFAPLALSPGSRSRRCRACTPQYTKGGNPDRAEKRAWIAANPVKRKAHKAVEYALLRGDIERGACERCGAKNLVYAHHDDYSRPLDVMWLCPAHHAERHREIGRPLGSRRAA